MDVIVKNTEQFNKLTKLIKDVWTRDGMYAIQNDNDYPLRFKFYYKPDGHLSFNWCDSDCYLCPGDDRLECDEPILTLEEFNVWIEAGKFDLL